MYKFLATRMPLVIIFGLALDLYLPAIPQMTKDLNVSPVAIQQTLSIYILVFAFGHLFIGPFSDKYGRKIPTLLCVSLFCISSLIISYTQSFTFIILARIPQALGAAGCLVIALSSVSDLYHGDLATRCFSFLKGLMGVAPITAPVIGAYISVNHGWSYCFKFLTIIGIITFLVALFFTKETLEDKNKIKKIQTNGYLKLIKNKTHIFYCLISAIAEGALFGYFSISPILYLGKLGISEQYFGILFGINACMFLFGGFISSFIIPKVGLNRSIILAFIGFIISGIFMFGLIHANGITVENFFIPNLLAAATSALLLAASADGAISPHKGMAGQASAMYGFFEYSIGCILGTLIMMLGETNESALGGYLILFGGIGLIFTVFFCKRNNEL